MKRKDIGQLMRGRGIFLFLLAVAVMLILRHWVSHC